MYSGERESVVEFAFVSDPARGVSCIKQFGARGNVCAGIHVYF